jgi:hypothetical protein
MSTATTPGKLNSSSFSAYEVIGEARQILRREAGGVRYQRFRRGRIVFIELSVEG